MAYTVYVIYSSSLDKYYTGYSQDITLRLQQRNAGKSVYTSKATDWLVKYTEVFPTRELATKREREIKSKKSRRYIEWLISSLG